MHGTRFAEIAVGVHFPPSIQSKVPGRWPAHIQPQDKGGGPSLVLHGAALLNGAALHRGDPSRAARPPLTNPLQRPRNPTRRHPNPAGDLTVVETTSPQQNDQLVTLPRGQSDVVVVGHQSGILPEKRRIPPQNREYSRSVPKSPEFRREAPRPQLRGHLLRSVLVYDATWPRTAAQLQAAGWRYDQALFMLGLIDDQNRLLPRNDDQHS